MPNTVKTLVANANWLIQRDGAKLCSLKKERKGFAVLIKGLKKYIKDLSEVERVVGTDVCAQLSEHQQSQSMPTEQTQQIYGFPCNGPTHSPLYDLRRKLPVYLKAKKSSSTYCAGHYGILFRKGWVKSFCPKLVTLTRHAYCGPYRSEQELESALANQREK